MIARNLYTGEAFAPAANVWYSWMEVPPPYGTRSIECKRGLTGPVFPLNPATMHPATNVADLFWKDAL